MATLEFYTNDIRSRLGTDSDINATMKFDFGKDGVIFVDAKNVPHSVDNEDRKADCTMKISLANFTKMADGKLNPAIALATGKIKIRGNMLVARKMQPVLKPE